MSQIVYQGDRHTIEVPDGATVGVEAITKIAPRSFEARLTDAEYAAIITKTLLATDAIKAGTATALEFTYYKASDQLSKAQYVDVTDPFTEQMIDFFISQGDIDPSRKAVLLAEGTEAEAA